MTVSIKRIFICLGFLCWASNIALAQDYKIKESFLTYLPGTFTVQVEFTDPIARSAVADINASTVKVTAMPSGRSLVPLRARLQPGSFRTVLVDLDPAQPPAATDTQFTICFSRLRFVDNADSTRPPVERTNVCDSAKIENETATQARLEELIKEVNAVPKSSEEKNIFASGFVTKGTGEDSEGGAELNLNSNDLGVPGLIANLHMKKTTAEKADPKHFDVGLNYSSTVLFHGAALDRIREAQNSGDTTAAQRELDSLKHAAWSGVTFDLGTSFEAQAFSFDVANFIGEGMVQIKSRVLPLRRLKEGEANSDRAGFYRFHFVPGGIEIGQNLNNGSDNGNGTSQPPPSDSTSPESVDWIARYKFGAGFTLFYRDLTSRWLFKRVELDAQFVGRYLFRREVMFDEATMMNISTTKGFKPWTQVGLKAYVADTPAGRFGLRVSYNKGSLPPVFSATSSFQFGLVYETADDVKQH